MKTKKILTLLLATALTLGLCACGKKNDYSDLEKLLDKGQYDAAITLIQQYKEDASKEPVSKADIEAEDQAYLDAIVGEYTLKNPFYEYDDQVKVIKVNADMTLTLDDATYPFEIKKNQDLKRYLSYKKTNADGSTWNDSVTFEIDEETGYVTTWTHHRLDQLTPEAEEIWSKLVGNYVYKYKDNEWGKDVSIGDDFTISFDGVEHPVAYKYDTVNYSTDEKGICFIYSPENDNSYNTLTYSIDEDGFVTLWGDYYREDQIEYVKLDGDNLYDYFEWSDYELREVNKNAFDEPSYTYFARWFALKDEYKNNIITGLSDIALEVTYNSVRYYDATVAFNATDDSFIIDKGAASTSEWDTSECTDTLSWISSDGDYDENGNWTVKRVYIMSSTFNGNLLSDNTVKNGDVYTFKTSLYEGLAEGNLKVNRSASVLAFKKVQ